jgi:hypothetical protein
VNLNQCILEDLLICRIKIDSVLVKCSAYTILNKLVRETPKNIGFGSRESQNIPTLRIIFGSCSLMALSSLQMHFVLLCGGLTLISVDLAVPEQVCE